MPLVKSKKTRISNKKYKYAGWSEGKDNDVRIKIYCLPTKLPRIAHNPAKIPKKGTKMNFGKADCEISKIDLPLPNR
ncbi:hypothetical protein M5X19_28590 [Paenibacillus alginolyticus]|uniref:Uncharacterized protein n=1 Tax=Paenibacillus alginolyticus TaxID=59839 RepID=A0ABT4GKU4_9BACL|nr:hypothetical protein [Paenibacillus alginolyticus]MCY9696830.1 hypothetical protein [Paenibacillus alginolyticus]